MIIISVFLLYFSYQIDIPFSYDPIGARLLPIIFAIGMLVFSIVGALSNIFKKNITQKNRGSSFNINVWITILSYFIYLLLVPIVSFVWASVIYIFFSIMFYSRKKMNKKVFLKAILISTGSVFALYLIFIRTLNLFL